MNAGPEGTPSRSPTLQQQLLQALKNRNLERFRELLQNPQVNPRYRYGNPDHGTCLQIATRLHDGGDYVRALLSRVSPNVNVVLAEPVHQAAKRGHVDVLAALLADHRTVANALDKSGRTALHIACINVTPERVTDYADCVKMLMHRFSPADINRPDNHGYTAIHAATKAPVKKTSPTKGERHDEQQEDELLWDARRFLIELMLDIGGDVIDLDITHVHGHTARQSLLVKFSDIREYLPEKLDLLRRDPQYALVTALQEKKLTEFQALLQETDAEGNPRIDPNHWFAAPVYATCLELACGTYNRCEFVEVLLAADADPNVPNKLNEKFPIHIACEKGYSDVLEVIFKCSKYYVDPNTSDRLGNTALHYVMENFIDLKSIKNIRKSKIKYELCLLALLERRDLLPNRLNDMKKSAIQLALESKNRFAIKNILEKKRGSVNVDLAIGKRTLREMILDEYPDMSNLLDKHDKASRTGWKDEEMQETRTKLLELLRKKKEATFEVELKKERTVTLSEIDPQNSLLLHAACNGLLRATCALLEATGGSEANVKHLPMRVSYHGHWDVLKLVLDWQYYKRIDVNATDVKGNTALHFAVQKKNLESVILLMQRGAKCTQKNKMGKEPFNHESLRGLLDCCVATNGAPSHTVDYEIVFDYRLLAATPLRENTSSECVSESIPMNVFQEDWFPNTGSVTDSPQKVGDSYEYLDSEVYFLLILVRHSKGMDLLNHPITASFISLKWERVRLYTYINTLLWLTFLVCLTTHVMMFAAPNTSESKNNSTSQSPDAVIIPRGSITELPGTVWPLLVFSLFFIFMGIIRLLNFESHYRNTGLYLGLVTVSVATWIAASPIFTLSSVQPLSLCVLTNVLVCLNLLSLMGRFIPFARNIEMLKVVAMNYMMAFVSFMVILVAFGFCFHILFRSSSAKEDHFGDLLYSQLKVIIMMSGEYEANELPLRSSAVASLTFALFVLGVTVLLLNLLIGLAVSDTQRIERDAELLRLCARVALVAEGARFLALVHNRAPTWLAACFCGLPRRSALFLPADTRKEARVRRNQDEMVELRGEMTLPSGRCEGPFVGHVLEEATRVLSQRARAGCDAGAAVTQQILEELRWLRQYSRRGGELQEEEEEGEGL